jgi:hypothetical protein
MEVECEVKVSRPRKEVAGFMFEPSNDAKWTTGVISCRPLTSGRLRAGSRVERTVQFGGRTFSYEYIVTSAGEDQFVEMTVDKPFPMWIRYQLDDHPDGTLVRIHTKGEPRGFFRLAAPLMKGKVRQNINSDLENLKRLVEGLDRTTRP